jgi:hypothetical protein
MGAANDPAASDSWAWKTFPGSNALNAWKETSNGSLEQMTLDANGSKVICARPTTAKPRNSNVQPEQRMIDMVVIDYPSKLREHIPSNTVDPTRVPLSWTKTIGQGLRQG